jgi:hypothetical protein
VTWQYLKQELVEYGAFLCISDRLFSHSKSLFHDTTIYSIITSLYVWNWILIYSCAFSFLLKIGCDIFLE